LAARVKANTHHWKATKRIAVASALAATRTAASTARVGPAQEQIHEHDRELRHAERDQEHEHTEGDLAHEARAPAHAEREAPVGGRVGHCRQRERRGIGARRPAGGPQGEVEQRVRAGAGDADRRDARDPTGADATQRRAAMSR
jgi:hypothetical protein